MARDKYAPVPRFTDDEMAEQLAAFQANGGSIIKVPENFKPEKKLDQTAVKIGKVYRQLKATKSS